MQCLLTPPKKKKSLEAQHGTCFNLSLKIQCVRKLTVESVHVSVCATIGPHEESTHLSRAFCFLSSNKEFTKCAHPKFHPGAQTLVRVEKNFSHPKFLIHERKKERVIHSMFLTHKQRKEFKKNSHASNVSDAQTTEELKKILSHI